MRLSTLVLCCVMILCCTGLFDTTARRLGVRTGSVAALCPLLAAVSGFTFAPFSWLRIGMGVPIVLLCGLCLCRKGVSTVVALLFSACAGACGFMLVRSLPGFYEPGFLLALPAAGAAALLCGDRRAALLCVLTAPLFFGVCTLFEGYYLFRTVLLDLSAVEVFDAETCGAALLFFLWWVRSLRPAALQLGSKATR